MKELEKITDITEFIQKKKCPECKTVLMEIDNEKDVAFCRACKLEISIQFLQDI